MKRRWLKIPLLLLAAAGLLTAYLVKFHGLHFEVDGSGIRPIFSLGDRQSHYTRLDETRELEKQQASAAPPGEPAALKQTAAPEPAAGPGSAPVTPRSSYWSDYRGPGRSGVYGEMPLLESWPARGLERLWKKPVGGGYASFAIAGGKAFTIEQRRGEEVAAAYDMLSGREVWANSWKADFRESMGGDGPRATPVWDEEKLYVQGAEGELRCLRAGDGSLVWRKNIIEENGAANLEWGMAASPLVVREKLITVPGGSGGKSVVAYNKATGKRLWSVLDDKAAYVSPMLVTLAGREQILVVTAARAVGLTPEDGHLLWEYPWVTSYDVNAAQPLVVSGNRFFISSGYGHGAAVVEVSPQGDAFRARAVWSNNRMKNKFNSSVLHAGYVYGLDEGILACIDVQTGALKWKGGRYGYGQLVLAGANLIVIGEQGDLALVKATPDKHTEVASFSAIEGKTWNNPALAEGLLLVRNTTEMACFRAAP